MRDEEKFPTVRFLTCKDCGHVFTASLTGENFCPKCHSRVRTSGDESRVRKQLFKGHVLFTLAGPLYKMQELEDLKVQVDAALSGEIESAAFHFEGASFLDSSMLGQLARTLKEMARRGKPTFVITSDAQVLESLQIIDLDRVVTIFPTAEAYQRSLA